MLEVGLGGRLDATNIVEPLVCVIADISLDHTEYLGNTLTEIASEKAGILRENGILVTLPQHPQANQAIGERAVALNVTGINAADYMPMPVGAEVETLSSATAIPSSFSAKRSPSTRRSPAPTSSATSHWPSPPRSRSPAALQDHRKKYRRRHPQHPLARSSGVHHNKNLRQFLLDVAHNPAGVWALRSVLAHLPDEQPKT